MFLSCRDKVDFEHNKRNGIAASGRIMFMFCKQITLQRSLNAKPKCAGNQFLIQMKQILSNLAEKGNKVLISSLHVQVFVFLCINFVPVHRNDSCFTRDYSHNYKFMWGVSITDFQLDEGTGYIYENKER
jgi:hypothetical protein